MKISVIQPNCGADRQENFDHIERLVNDAVTSDRPDLVALPETFAVIGGNAARRRELAEPLPANGDDGGPAYEFLRRLAATHDVFIHGGSFVELVPAASGDRYYNTTVAFDRVGRELARYRKIHRFDVTTPDGAEYRESAMFEAGDAVVTYQADEVKIGCTICYDLRFAELYIALAKAGAELIMVPSAFTMQTGKDHWEVLLRARAIETQTYVAAPAQTGAHMEGNETRLTWGHSMIVDPWGHILGQAADGPGHASARIDIDRLRAIRARLPAQSHRRL